jgi:hypothetical protein
VPGIGKILAWVICPPGQVRQGVGSKRHGTSGQKIGNVHLKWAFSEASMLFLRANPKGQRFVEKLSSKHGKAKALSILAHKLGPAVYYMLKRKQAFDMNKFLNC